MCSSMHSDSFLAITRTSCLDYFIRRSLEHATCSHSQDGMNGQKEFDVEAMIGKDKCMSFVS